MAADNFAVLMPKSMSLAVGQAQASNRFRRTLACKPFS